MVVLLAGCNASPGPSMAPHSTDSEARQDLARLVTLAQSGDIPGLCQHGTGNCSDTAAAMDAKSSAPSTSPTIVGSREVADAANQQGGRALMVCGVDRLGRDYRNEILFFGQGKDFTAIESLFWLTGLKDPSSVAPTASPGPEWGSCP